MSLEQLLDTINDNADDLEDLGVGPGDIQWTQRTGNMEDAIAGTEDPTQANPTLDVSGATPFSWVVTNTAAEAREAFVMLAGMAKTSANFVTKARALRTIRRIIDKFSTSTNASTGASTGAQQR